MRVESVAELCVICDFSSGSTFDTRQKLVAIRGVSS